MAIGYDDVLRNVGTLSREDQLRLISDIAERLRMCSGAQGVTSILELQGLGKEIWREVDAQEYVDAERSSWDG